MRKLFNNILILLAVSVANSENNFNDWLYGKLEHTKLAHSLTNANTKSFQTNGNFSHSENSGASIEKSNFQHHQLVPEPDQVFHPAPDNNGNDHQSREEKGRYEYRYTGEGGEEVLVYVSEPEYDGDWNDFVNDSLEVKEDVAVTLSKSPAGIQPKHFRMGKAAAASQNIVEGANATIQRQDEGDPEEGPSKPHRCRVHHYHHHYHNQVHDNYHCYHHQDPDKGPMPPNQQTIQHIHHHHGCKDKTVAATVARKLGNDVGDENVVVSGNGTKSSDLGEKRDDSESDKGPDKGPDKSPQHHIHHHHYHHHSRCRHIHHHLHHHRHIHHHHFQHCPTNPQGGLRRSEFDVTGQLVGNLGKMTGTAPVSTEKEHVESSKSSQGTGAYVKLNENVISEFVTTMSPTELEEYANDYGTTLPTSE